MENEPAAAPSPLNQALEEARAAAWEQLSAAWQLQVERVEEQLNSGWREQVGRVVEERFAELAARLTGEYDRALAGRRAAVEDLGAAVRRLSRAQTAGEWTEALLDGLAPHSRRCCLFTVALRALIAEGLRGFDAAEVAEWLGREIPLETAPALAAAVESRDVVVALGSSGELSAELATLVGASDEEKVHLYPVLARGRSAALLLVEPAPDPAAAAAVELLVAVAGLALGARPAPASLVALEPTAVAAPSADQELHLAAQRFARVQAAEMRLYRSAEVRGGRTRRDLYTALQGPIDKAREAYRRQFLTACPSMVDYLHRELVRTLANDDEAALGPSYPGPLV